MRKSLTIYLLLLGCAGLALSLALDYGRGLSTPSAELPGALLPAHGQPVLASPGPASIWADLRGHLEDPLTRLLLQLMLIVLATRAVGALFVRLNQPAVIGEMAAGVLLGPSLLGWIWPDIQQFLFPISSLGTLKLLSQIGVCLYLFVVGMQLDIDHIRTRASTVLVVSHSSIILPFLLGVVASLALYSRYAPTHVSFVSFALFMGIAMSITAFPVLARILEERGLTRTNLGTLAITCAAVNDVTAWIALAAIVAIVHAAGIGWALLSLSLVLIFVLVMFCVIRRRLPGWMRVNEPGATGMPPPRVFARVLLLILGCSITTEVIGIHALFGAFLAGVVMPPQSAFRQYISVRIEQFSTVFLLPLFFAFTGLRTQVGVLNDATNWIVFVALLLVATSGKLGGSMLSARLMGMSWRDSFSLGALMNTRGLMELIALNLGYEFGILSPAIFTIMVLVALSTTVMTGALLSVAQRTARLPISAMPARASTGCEPT